MPRLLLYPSRSGRFCPWEELPQDLAVHLSIPLSVSQANKKPSCREKIAAVDDDDQTWGAINFLIYSTFAVLIAMVMLGVSWAPQRCVNMDQR